MVGDPFQRFANIILVQAGQIRKIMSNLLMMKIASLQACILNQAGDSHERASLKCEA
jgi:hypothetical protein